MEVKVDFYADFFTWAEQRAAQIAQHGDILKVASFAQDFGQILHNLVGLVEGFGKLAHGNPIAIAMNVAGWVAGHPDPLAPTREGMRAMRVKFGEVVANG